MANEFTRNCVLALGLKQDKTIGGLLKHNSEVKPLLLTPIKIRGTTFHNRIFVSPMCMFACDNQDGLLTDFHMAHYGNMALRGPGLVMIEGAAVESRGRVSPEDAGIWDSEHIGPFQKVINLIHASGSKAGVQLSHSGRKGGTPAPFIMFEEKDGKLGRDGVVPKSKGGFSDEIVAPSPLPWKNDGLFPVPHELTVEEIKEIVQKFADGAKRAVEAGADTVEIHAGHGYLSHNFLSGNTNKRTDEYGGSLDNRLRFFLEIITKVREVIPEEMPLFCRVSGTDFVRGKDILSPDPDGWDIAQVIELCKQAVPLGVDLIDISGGTNLSDKKMECSFDLGFHVPLSAEVKKANISNLIVGSVGGLGNGKFSEQVLQDGKADVTFVGREFINNPSYVYTAAKELGVKVRWANQYSYFWGN